MKLRSLLFVPGDRPERMQKALGLGADALILDLEDAVAAEKKPEARAAVAAFVKANPDANLWVRINPLDGADVAHDLATLAGLNPTGVVLPKAEGGASVAELARRLDGQGNAASRVLAIATETPAAIFQLGTYGGQDRLEGLSWGAEDLPAALGAATSREENGSFTPPYELARSLCLFGAAAAGVAPIETVYPNFRDLDGLAAYAARARRDGFTGMMAIHPAQVPVINAAFTPSEAEVAHARAVIAQFAANPGAGALQLDGKMIDRPHLVQAQRTLGLAGS
ncbi:HpcH/HpaI aldolase/citrate lyase family protein [Allosphingosinicella vermicomposti]|uniref:HpcH/HpaI aldolase/citrate lyase family protein n=1 Tax=Allosphingosinicella vermicomposti TaxID=614671 RepID=UPI000D113B90|nr:CoA ester lyase [Allosphingosinicella vermicomposti]